MSRFAKIMLVLLVLCVISFFLFLMSMAAAFTQLAGGVESGSIKEKKAHITVLKIEGPIMASEKYLESIQRISEDEACKGILLRIDSPGGAVGASQEIFTALKGLKAKGLPIIVTQGNLAASGGYYISLAGDKIFSNPGTLTASIGVIMQFPEASKLMEKVGLGLYTVKSGALKDVGNYSRAPTQEEIRYLQDVIDNTYNQFLDDIVASRKLERAELIKIADGRVMTGKQALKGGLVDTLGGFQEAQAYLVKLAHLDGKPLILKEPPSKHWLENFVESNASSSLSTLTQAAKELLPLVQQGSYFIWK
jgi:protease IV